MRLAINGLVLTAACVACTDLGPGAQSPLSKSERTLWQVCWDAEGAPEYPSDEPPHEPACDDWGFIRWQSLPIKVGVEVSAAPIGQQIIGAVNYWNARLGFRVFRLLTTSDMNDDVPPVPDVMISLEPDHPWLLGIAHLHRSPLTSYLSARVVLYADTSPPFVTIVHELGHVLGLAHDNQGESIMNSGRLDWTSVHVSSEDIRALRLLYRDEVP